MTHENRVVIITGGTGALGTAVTQAFLHAGALVTTTYHNAAGFSELQSALGPEKARLTGIGADMTKEGEVQNLIDHNMNKFGRIDILINLVGGFAGGKNIADTPVSEWDRMLNLNLKSTFLTCRAVLPRMLAGGYGRIVNTSSRGALEVGAGVAAYAVSKAGVITLTQAIAKETKGWNVTANVILPGIIDTLANRQSMPEADFSTWVTPQSIAKVLLFLTSEEAKVINGASVPIFGAG